MGKRQPTELFELIKKGRVELRTPAAKQEIQAAQEAANQPASSLASQARPGGPKPYPKWRVPFPTASTSAGMGEKILKLKYNAVILVTILFIIALILAYVLGTRGTEDRITTSKEPKKPVPVETPVTTPSTPIEKPVTPVTPSPASVRSWKIRLVYYDDDTAGRSSARNMVKWLKGKGINDASVEKERIGGTMRQVIYTSKFDTPEEATRQLGKYRRLHSAFRHCEVVEKK